MFSFVVSNGAEYYDQRNETAFSDKLKKKEKKSSVASWTNWIKAGEFCSAYKIPKF